MSVEAAFSLAVDEVRIGAEKDILGHEHFPNDQDIKPIKEGDIRAAVAFHVRKGGRTTGYDWSNLGKRRVRSEWETLGSFSLRLNLNSDMAVDIYRELKKMPKLVR